MEALYFLIPLVLIFAVWLFLIAPGKNKRMQNFKNKKYAHRGLHGTVGYLDFAAENSLTAFARAVEHGFGIELDVQVSKDGEVVVFHDNTLKRVTGAEGRIKDFTLAELKELSLLGTADTIPTLSEVLELVDGRVPLLVELKETGTDHTISEQTVKVLKDYKGDFIVESFSPIAFGAFRKNMPDVPRGFLSDKLTRNKSERTLKHRITQRYLLTFIGRPSFLAIHHKRSRLFPIPLIKLLFRVPTIAWTVKSQEEELAAYKNGFDGVIFENYIPEKTERGADE